MLLWERVVNEVLRESFVGSGQTSSGSFRWLQLARGMIHSYLSKPQVSIRYVGWKHWALRTMFKAALANLPSSKIGEPRRLIFQHQHGPDPEGGCSDHWRPCMENEMV